MFCLHFEKNCEIYKEEHLKIVRENTETGGHVDVGTFPHQVLAATLSRESLPYPYSNQGTVRCIAVKVAVSTMS
jgi:hypothetical protein